MMIFTTTPTDKAETLNKNKDKKKTAAAKAGDYIVRLTAVLFWVGLWWICSAAVGKEILLPSPPAVARRLVELCSQGDFWLYCGSSLLRVLSGFLLGLVTGSALGALMYASALMRRLFDPLLAIVKATPVASFIILALVWIKSMLMPVFIAFLIVLPIVCSNIYEGLRSTDRQLIEMCDMYNVTGIRRVTALYIPSAASYALAAGRAALGLAWKAGVAAEVIGRTARSVGDMLYQSKLYLETVDLFAWTAAVVILSRALETAVFYFADMLSRKLSLTAGEGKKHDNA